jgi:hypothetical protein
MKKIIVFLASIVVIVVLINTPIRAKLSTTGESPELVIANFDKGNKPNLIGGEYGSWNYAPNDETQGCWDWFEPKNYDGKDGYSVVLEYDVKSPNPAFCGFWMKLGNVDITAYDILSLWLKGDEKAGFTSRFKIELKNNRGKRAVYTVSGVSDKWQVFDIPFKQTRAINDWSQMSEMTVVFDDILATKKTGKILLDQIVFRKYTPEELTALKEALAPEATS